jgi:hypothetical protein
VKSGVIPEFCQRKKATPLSGSILNGTAKEHFHALVHTLALAIGLRVISSSELELGAKLVKELLPEHAREDLVTIGDDGVRHAVEFDNRVHKQMSYCWSGERMAKWNKMGKLGEAIKTTRIVL